MHVTSTTCQNVPRGCRASCGSEPEKNSKNLVKMFTPPSFAFNEQYARGPCLRSARVQNEVRSLQRWSSPCMRHKTLLCLAQKHVVAVVTRPTGADVERTRRCIGRSSWRNKKTWRTLAHLVLNSAPAGQDLLLVAVCDGPQARAVATTNRPCLYGATMPVHMRRISDAQCTLFLYLDSELPQSSEPPQSRLPNHSELTNENCFARILHKCNWLYPHGPGS